MKKTFFIILSFAIAISCSETLRPDFDNIGINQQQEISAPDYHIGLETALESLDEFFDAMDGTKSTSDRIRIADVIRLGRQPGTTVKSTESTDTSTILYVVNFEDDAGYAVLAADSRLPVDIYAVTEKGRADRNDLSSSDCNGETFNPLAIIHASAASIINVSDSLIKDPDADYPKHPILNDTLRDIWAGEWVITRWGPWTTSINYPAMLMTQWGQGSPYKDMTGAQYAGCGVTAVAQMMAYNQYPPLLDGISLPYYILRKMQHISINSAYADDVAVLFKHIFIGCKAKSYGEDGTLVWPKNIVTYLENLGYKNVDIYKNPSKFNTSLVYNSIIKGYPAIITAVNSDTDLGDIITGNGDAHTWVIDGYVKQARHGEKVGEKTGQSYGGTGESREFVHCNWGWNGNYDGYFYPGIFNENKPAPYRDQTKSSQGTGSYERFYRIITYNL